MYIRINRYSYIFSLVIVILMFSQIVNAAPPALSFGNVKGIPGEQIAVPVYISSSSGIDSFNMVVLYDPQALQAGVGGVAYFDRTGTLTANYDMFAVNANTPGRVAIGAATLTPITRGGVLMKLLFTIKPDASGKSALKFELANDIGNDLTNARVTDGLVSVSSLPTIVSTSPTDGENAPVDTQISATFNNDMEPSSINKGTFTIKNPTNFAVPGLIKYSNNTVTFTPLKPLEPNTMYTATLNSGIRDKDRKDLGNNYAWIFTTSSPDPTPPTVLSTFPENNQNNVPVDLQIAATFSKSMDISTLNRGTFTIKDSKGSAMLGAITYTNKTMQFSPNKLLSKNMTYTATLNSKISDAAGNNLGEDHTWSFTTELPDTTPPVVLATNPEANQNNVPTKTQITATFSEDLNPSTVNKRAVTIKDQKGSELGIIVNYNNRTATFTPYRTLKNNTTYTVALNQKITDLEKNPLSPYVWSFTTQ